MLVPPADLVGRAKATIKECSVNDVKARLESNTILIDVREPAEFAGGHLPGALHLPRGMLEFEVHDLVARQRTGQPGNAEDHPIVLYCGTGGRSALAAAAMAALGYRNVSSMAGGMAAWKEAGLPLAAV